MIMDKVLFQKLKIYEPELQAEIRAHGKITYHEKGNYLIRANSYIKVLKIVLKGRVRVFQEQEGKEILIYYLSAMETCTLSLSACFEHCQSNVSAIVEEDTYVLNIPVRFIKDWCFKYNSWNQFTINTFRDSYSILLAKYAQLAFKPLKTRVWDYLKERIDEKGCLNMSHQQVANELGTTREVISRLLKGFEKEGQLSLGQKSIKILSV